MLKINNKLLLKVNELAKAKTDIFSELVELSGLNPDVDFRFANLQDVDLRGSDLRNFNFAYADLRGAIWGDPHHSEPTNYRCALRGERRDAIRGSDYKEIFERARYSKTWSERFFAFALAVDNFGENFLTLDLLSEIIRADKSKYYIVSSYTYFIASYIDHKEALRYCRTMALASNSRINMFRFKKLKRIASEIFEYTNTIEKEMRYPGDISPDTVCTLFEEMVEAGMKGPTVYRGSPVAMG